MNYSLDEQQWKNDWSNLVCLAATAGNSLEQAHVFALAHILRRPIIIYAVKFVKGLRGESIDLARFEGIGHWCFLLYFVATTIPLLLKQMYYFIWKCLLSYRDFFFFKHFGLKFNCFVQTKKLYRVCFYTFLFFCFCCFWVSNNHNGLEPVFFCQNFWTNYPLKVILRKNKFILYILELIAQTNILPLILLFLKITDTDFLLYLIWWYLPIWYLIFTSKSSKFFQVIFLK